MTQGVRHVLDLVVGEAARRLVEKGVLRSLGSALQKDSELAAKSNGINMEVKQIPYTWRALWAWR